MLKMMKHNNFRCSAKQAGFVPTYWSVSEISNGRQLPTDSPGVLLM
jgi:hypothetical protein